MYKVVKKVILSSLQPNVSQCLHTYFIANLLPVKKKKKKCVHIDFRQAIVQALVESATDAPRPQKKGQKSAEMLGWLTDISLDISK